MAEWIPTKRQFASDLLAGFVVVVLVALTLWAWQLANERGVSKMPWKYFDSLTPWQIATIILSGCIAALILGSFQIVNRNAKPSAPPNEQQLAEAEATIDPHQQIFTKIMRVDFTGLFAEHDPYIDFVVYVKQTTDWIVKITDVRGRMTIGGIECSLPAHLSGTHPRVLRDPRGFYDCTVRQPLTQDMAQAMYWDRPYGVLDLRSTDSRLNISLAGLTWVGTVTLPQGEVPLPDRAVCDEAFTILGPISEVDADKVFVRGGVFLSSQVWRHHESGLLRDRE